MRPGIARRLVSTGNVVADLVLGVPRLPERGGDLPARSAVAATGGAFNLMAAAARLGLPAVYAGVLGSGPRGDRAAADLAAEHIAVINPRVPRVDTGLVVCLVEPDGERSFVTAPGAETALSPEHLTAAGIAADDVVHVSGYSLAYATNRSALLGWLPDLPDDTEVSFDPGPLVGELPADALDAVLHDADLVTCNQAEAGSLTGEDDPERALEVLRARLPRATLVVRAGALGAWLAGPEARPLLVPAFAATAVDTTGAGDAHTGALLAFLARGKWLPQAIRLANAAAAYAVTQPGPATGPTAAQLQRFLAENRTGP